MLRVFLQSIMTLMLLLSLSGCSQLGTLNFSRMFESAIGQSETTRIADIRTETDHLLSQNKPVAALTVIRNGIDSGLPQEKMADSYVRTINSLMATADRMFLERSITKAGNSYSLALKNYPTHPALKKQIIRNQNEIHQQINTCAEQLLDTGLIAYRNGELQTAIDTWSQIREFHPTYKASQQAIQTTRIQLKNLQSIKDGPG